MAGLPPLLVGNYRTVGAELLDAAACGVVGYPLSEKCHL